VQRALSGFLSAMQCIVSAGVSRSNSQECCCSQFFSTSLWFFHWPGKAEGSSSEDLTLNT